MRRVSLHAVITAVAVMGSAMFVLSHLQPGLLVAGTTPAGGDMGAHVWGPAFLRDHVLPHGRLTGWTGDWYAGFPAYFFYFPLPNLAVVALDVVVPYGVAFKLVTVSGLVSLPVAGWGLGRLMRLPFPTPALLAVSTVLFVFDRFHTIWGGNAAATLAGEFAFSIALSLALVFIGVAYRALETGRGRALAGVLLAATALSHLLPAAFAVVAVLVLLVLRRPDLVRWRLVATIGVLGFLLAAFWFVPFMVRHLQGFSNDMGWERTQEYVKNLLPWLRTDDGAPHAATRHLRVTMPLALLGAVLGVIRRRRGTIALALVAAASAAAFVLIPNGAIWNARFLPFWYLSTYLLAATAVGEAMLWSGEGLIAAMRRSGAEGAESAEGEVVPAARVPNVPALVAPLLGLIAVVVVTGLPLGTFSSGRLDLPGDLSVPFPRIASTETSFVPAWARWNYSGYEQKASYPEYREVVQTMERVGRERGCGRAMWEYEPDLNRFGTPMALMLLPHWTDGCIGSMEGLFFESSATVPYHFLNQSELSRTPSRAMRDLPYRDLDVASGVRHLQLMGVRYYMAVNPETQAQAAANPDLELIATTGTYSVDYEGTTQDRFWQIYEVTDSALVEPLENEPLVVDGVSGQDEWLDVAVAWYQDDTRWDVPLAASGPEDWPRARSVDDLETAPAPREPVAPNEVSEIEVDDQRISFRVEQVGVPVMVRMSYFPNWRASGAEGPWRVTPNFMVVVPTTTEVTLHYGWTGVDIAGWALTALGVLLAVALARVGPAPVPARRDRSRDEAVWVDPFLTVETGEQPAPAAPARPTDPNEGPAGGEAAPERTHDAPARTLGP